MREGLINIVRTKRERTYLTDFFVDSYIERGEIVLVFDDELWVLPKKQTEAVDVAVFTAKVARRIAVEVLGVNVYFFLNQGFDDVEVTTDTCNMQWRPKILGPAVQVATKLREHFNQLDMAFVRRHMHRGPAITIAFV